MTSRSSLSRFSGPAFLALALLGNSAHAIAADATGPTATQENEATKIDTLVISASRTPQDPKWVSSSVTALSLADLSLEQFPTIESALQTVPGIILANSGAHGSQSSLLLRGASSHQVLFIVDGVRMNDRSTPYFNFLGGATLGGLDRVEILRGPQSTLYGSGAIGGVILLDTARGKGPFHGVAEAGGGSWKTLAGGLSVEGASGPVSVSAHLDHGETDNERPNNGFRQTSESARVEGTLTPALLVGATIRADQSRYKEVGSRTYPSSGAVDNDNTLTTVYLDAKPGADFDSRLTLAYHERHYTYASLPKDDPWAFTTVLRNQRKVLDWQNTWQARRDLELIAGVDYERSSYSINGTEGKDRILAGFLSSTYRPLANVIVTAGLRHDDYESAGGTTTGRAGVSWLPVSTTKLRFSWGKGFVAPGVDDRYGYPGWGQLESPGLKPERSNGWDVGIDQEVKALQSTFGITYFDTTFKDLFSWQSLPNYEGRIVNIANASSCGLEFSAKSTWAPWLKSRLAYTYLDARDGANHSRLIRRPYHTIDGEVSLTPDTAWSFGVGAHVVAGNNDDVAYLTRRTLPSHTTVRAFASYQATRALLLKLRLENVLDADYEEVFGYPTLGRSLYGSVEWKF